MQRRTRGSKPAALVTPGRGSCVAGKPGEHELCGLDVSSTLWGWLLVVCNPGFDSVALAFSWQKYTPSDPQKTAEGAVGFSLMK